MNTGLINDILTYMEDETLRYAIALEGDWGSGKTRFCEHELANHLYAQGYTLLRVSLFGVASVDELYGRLAMSIVRLGGSEDDSRFKKFLKSATTFTAQAGISFGRHMAEEYGISLEASPRMLTGMLGRKHLLVLDDAERHRYTEEADLYGAINDLVEGQQCKVMLVTNNFANIGDLLREKTVWRCYRFDPSSDDLVREIITPRLSETATELDFDIEECICRAAREAECHNARAMLKSIALLRMAFGSRAISDASVDATNRMMAAKDFTRFMFLAAMGSAPVEPQKQEQGKGFDHDEILRSIEYNQYSQLWVIAAYFDPKEQVGVDEVETCLRSYIQARYAGSPDTMTLARALDQMQRLMTMEDEETSEVAKTIAESMRKGTFDLSYLNGAIRDNALFRRLGFEQALTEDEVVERAKRMVDNDIDGAHAKVHREYSTWKDEWGGRYLELAEIDAYIVERYQVRQRERTLGITDEVNANTGREIVDEIVEGLKTGAYTHLSYKPETIAVAFERGNAESQAAIYHLVSVVRQWYIFSNEDSQTWLRNLLEELEKAKPSSRTGRLRLEWTSDALRKCIKSA